MTLETEQVVVEGIALHLLLIVFPRLAGELPAAALDPEGGEGEEGSRGAG